MRKLILIFAFVLLLSVPAFCSSDFSYSYYTTSAYYYYYFNDVTSEGTIVKYRVDTTSNSGTYFYFVSDKPISGTFVYKLNDTVKTTLDVDASSASRLYIASSSGVSSSSNGAFGGLYAVRLYCSSRTNLSYSDVNYYYTDVSSTTDSDFISRVQSDFFLIAPGAEVGTEATTEVVTGQTEQTEQTEQTLAEFLVGYLKLGVGLVISLMALLVVLSLLVKYLRRSLG